MAHSKITTVVAGAIAFAIVIVAVVTVVNRNAPPSDQLTSATANKKGGTIGGDTQLSTIARGNLPRQTKTAVRATSTLVQSNRGESSADVLSDSVLRTRDSPAANAGEQGSSPPAVQGKTVVGRPFATSKSVTSTLDQCEEVVRKRGFDFCTDIKYKLAMFAKEERDAAWAPTMEQRIRNHLAKIDSMHFQIRNIKCRRTLCAAEVASVYGQYLGLAFPESSAVHLHGVNGIESYEMLDTGQKVTVTLQTYEPTKY